MTAASACGAWRKHAAQPGPLWEAVVLPEQKDAAGIAVPPRDPGELQSLLRWLLRHGPRIRQLHIGASIGREASDAVRLQDASSQRR